MFKRKAPFIAILSIAVVFVVALTIAFRPVTASATEYMQLSAQERIDFAKARYSEFSANPDK